MHSVVTVDPFRCRMWSLHDRLEKLVNEQTCRAEIESFGIHGQLMPVLGRTVRDDPQHDVELIYGARRLFTARHLNRPIVVELRELSDRDAIVALDIENRQRQQLSPYERGVSFTKWMRAGCFSSQEELAETLNISPPVVSRLMKLARLPTVIVSAFKDPTMICESWGGDLIDALDDPGRRQPTIQRARQIAGSDKPQPADQVYRELLAAGAKGRKVKFSFRDEVVPDENGAALFRIRQQHKMIAVMLPADRASNTVMESIRSALLGIFLGGSAQETDPADSRTELGCEVTPGRGVAGTAEHC